MKNNMLYSYALTVTVVMFLNCSSDKKIEDPFINVWVDVLPKNIGKGVPFVEIQSRPFTPGLDTIPNLKHGFVALWAKLALSAIHYYQY